MNLSRGGDAILTERLAGLAALAALAVAAFITAMAAAQPRAVAHWWR